MFINAEQRVDIFSSGSVIFLVISRPLCPFFFACNSALSLWDQAVNLGGEV